MNMNNKIQLLNELQNINIKNIKSHIFQDLMVDAYCYKVYDADTISVIFKYKDEIIKTNLRISRIDSPEIKSKNELEKNKAIEGREYLKKLILNKLILIKIGEQEKYSRLLAEIYTLDNNLNINDYLVKGGYAKYYNGGKKEEWNFN